MKLSKRQVRIIAAVVVPLVVIGAGVLAVQNMNTKTIKGDLYQCIMGETFEYSDKSKLIKGKNENSSHKIENDGQEMELDPTPLYQKNGEQIILPITMSVVLPAENGKCNKVNYFSTISKIEDKVKINSSKNYLSNGFLYDGKDTYVFLEPVELRIGENKIKLSAFSYVIVARDQQVAYYNLDKNQYNYSETGTIVVRAVTKEGYEVDLANDCIIQKNAQKILMVDPKLLKTYI